MIYNTFTLDPRYPDCLVNTYIHDDVPELNMPPRRAIIVCPGGGYQFLSDREAEPVALQYFAAGLNV
ncbi:MAG: alpha/beta hydrolase, partial [Ruminococcaceae bacterium]|nr:alpha/beta hydrolase [Oscillospiraceae bacterium]